MRCPYCDTQYERQFDGTPVHFTVERPGVHKIVAQIEIDNLMTSRCQSEEISARAIRKLREGIADALTEYMRLEISQDPKHMCQIIRGEVRVLYPSFRE